MANIDEVVKTIKSSASTIIASSELQKNFLLDDAGENCPNYPFGCQRCDSRNQYIIASRYFYYDNQLFIDGHY